MILLLHHYRNYPMGKYFLIEPVILKYVLNLYPRKPENLHCFIQIQKNKSATIVKIQWFGWVKRALIHIRESLNTMKSIDLKFQMHIFAPDSNFEIYHRQ